MQSFHFAWPRYGKERYPYDFVFLVETMNIRLSDLERKYLPNVYTLMKPDRYVELESDSETYLR